MPTTRVILSPCSTASPLPWSGVLRFASCPASAARNRCEREGGLIGSRSRHRKDANFSRSRLAVLVAKMPVNSHRQRAAVSMTEPATHRGNIHAALNADRCEEMAQRVVRELRNLAPLARACQRPVNVLNAGNGVARLATFQREQEVPAFGNHRNGPLAGFALRATHANAAFLKINVAPR